MASFKNLLTSISDPKIKPIRYGGTGFAKIG
jgi:hypothetical protein